jgi:hypothetical protein
MARTPSPATRRAGLTTALGLMIAAAGFWLLDSPQARAADNETRNFSISVDGKTAGDYQMTILRQADGSVIMTARSDVKVTVLAIPVYTYAYRGREVWKDGQLQRFESVGKEKGKDFHILAVLDGSTLRVTSNGQEHRAGLDVWTTSCWQLPKVHQNGTPVVLLGCDTGAETNSQLQYLGAEKLTIAGQEMTCSHYRVAKDVPHDLWYDAQERLVRDEWVSGGHRSVVEMTGAR